ncbi:MAG: prepilin-type N-terminal cleavage/methylation domain-containing protein [bacterium]|nr:prepilin-type N-terminal cleavage/methylation domain-containing protein [bacterium]
MKNIHSKQSGFTIVEMMISTAVFVIVIVVLMDLTFIFIRDPLNLAKQKELEQDMTYAMDEMSFIIRHGAINWDRYPVGVPPNPYPLLYFLKNDKSPGLFHISTHKRTGLQESLTIGDGVMDRYLVGDDVIIDELNFFVYPTKDPYDLTNDVHAQPMVIISLTGHHIDDDSIKPITMQTIATTRYYER